MEINFFFQDNIQLRLNKAELIKRFEKIAFFEKYCLDAINYIFVSDRTILLYNKSYLNHKYPTDIITFDYSEDFIISGDIYISLDTIKYNSKKFNSAIKNELNRVMVHGLLHLMKLNDKSAAQKIEMRKKEDYYLKLFS